MPIIPVIVVVYGTKPEHWATNTAAVAAATGIRCRTTMSSNGQEKLPLRGKDPFTSQACVSLLRAMPGPA